MPLFRAVQYKHSTTTTEEIEMSAATKKTIPAQNSGAAKAVSVEEQLKAAQAEIARLTELARAEATQNARFAWENPEIIQAQPRMGYNFKMEPELYLKIKWIVENVGGMKSMQVFLDRAANLYADETIKRFTTAK